MAAKVKVIIAERNDIELQYKEEANPSNDLLLALGVLCDGNITVTGGSLDPSVSGFPANIGSVYFAANGNIYKKNDIGDTAWDALITGSSVYIRTAATSIILHRVLTTNQTGEVYYADNTIPAHKKKLLGIALQSVSAGSLCQIAVNGDEITEQSWNWDVDIPIFLGANGILTQTSPTSGFSAIVANPLTATSLRVGIVNPITLI
jgi:hypothetical protein